MQISLHAKKLHIINIENLDLNTSTHLPMCLYIPRGQHFQIK